MVLRRFFALGAFPLAVALVLAEAQRLGRGGEPQTPTNDQQLIQGTWECVAAVKDGKQVATCCENCK